jgi:conjugal transfer mating pair stabilization protein TraN
MRPSAKSHRTLSALLAWIAALLLIATPTSQAAPSCVKESEVCVEGPQTRTISGYAVYRDCWRTRSQYRCVAATSNDDCQPLRDQGCSQVGSKCIDATTDGLCMVYEQSWQCKTASGKTSTVTNCGDQRFCLEGNCFDTAHSPDPDFARVVTGLEIQRQAGQYVDPSNLEIFKGYDNRCRKKLFGLVNCCKGGGSDGSLFSAWALISGAGGQAIGAIGSTYTYDALFAADAPDLLISGFETLFGAGGGTSALAGVIAGDVAVETFVTSLVPGPWTLAILAIQLSGLLSCEQAEQILAMKKDNQLCHSVGSYCSQKVPILGTCVETTQTYCCFNSRLARIINEQGRAQVNRTWGAPKGPNCSGFTVEQLQALDFSRMDLSAFYAEIAPRLPSAGQQSQWGQQVQQRIQNALSP